MYMAHLNLTNDLKQQNFINDGDKFFLDDEQSNSIINSTKKIKETLIPNKIINFLQSSLSDVLFAAINDDEKTMDLNLDSNEDLIVSRYNTNITTMTSVQQRHSNLNRSNSNQGPTMSPIQKLFDINKMIQINNNNNNILEPPYSTRSFPEISFFDVNSSDESSQSSPSDMPPIFTTSIISNVTNDIFSVNKPPVFSPISNQIMTTTITVTTAIIDDQIEENDFLSFGGPQCFSSPENYELFTSMLCSSLLVLGVVYLTYGYRCFRAFGFFVGMVFGAALFHTVCTAENITIVPSLVPYGTLSASLLAGVLVGLFTMLVAYIGLFVIGIHLGLLLAVGLLIVIYLLQPYYLVLQAPLSALTLLIFFVALSLVGALTTVYFSKGCTILASSMYGSALTLLCADYFLEDFKVIHWFLDQLSGSDSTSSGANDWYGLLTNIKRSQSLCLGSHIILILWPIFTMFGIILQSCCTAKHFKYRNGYGMVDNSGPPSISINQPFSRESIRSLHHYYPYSNSSSNINLKHSSSGIRCNATSLEEARLEQRHRKYRYLYQVRTAHGDVISQHYLQSLQNKKLCLPDQDSFTFNSDLSSHFLPSESRTTTLSAA